MFDDEDYGDGGELGEDEGDEFAVGLGDAGVAEAWIL